MHFPPSEIMNMTAGDLCFWYERIREMEEDRNQ